MDLDEFVKETLVRIAKGVHEAKAGVEDAGGAVNPSTYTETHTALLREKESGLLVQEVEFDVAVVVNEASKGEVGGGILVAAFGLGAKAQEGLESASTHRIQFKVPILLPGDPDAKAPIRGTHVSRR